MASEPLEQADVVQRFMPLTPSAIDIWAAAMSDIIIGARKGLTLPGPFSTSTFACSYIVFSPPMPLPTITPISCSLLSSILSPESFTASMLAATAICAKRSMWRASLRLI